MIGCVATTPSRRNFAEIAFCGWWTSGAQPQVACRSQVLLDRFTCQPRRPCDRALALLDLPATNYFFDLHPMQLPIPHPVHLVLWWPTWWRMGPSGGLMLDGDLLAYSSMAICPFTGLFLVAIHTVTIAALPLSTEPSSANN